MNDHADLDDIETLLERAQRELTACDEIRGGVTSLGLLELNESLPRHEQVIKFVDEAEWSKDAPVLKAIQQWMEIHWDYERSSSPPKDTVVTIRRPAPQYHERFDHPKAARKLVVAAALYGTRIAAQCAMVFASHAMVEEHSMHLLKGPSIAKPVPLDAWCTLLPYDFARQRARASLHGEVFPSLPTDMHNICALECKSFARPAANVTFNDEWFGSPLVQDGLELLLLVITLVSRTSFRLIRSWHAKPAANEAVLPFQFVSRGGSTTFPVEFPTLGFSDQSKLSPLPRVELTNLLRDFRNLARRERRRLEVALRRLRNVDEKLDEEDAVIDLCIALEALFMEESERINQRKIIARRGSWYIAYSLKERQHARETLKEFYNLRSKIVHGNAPLPQTSADIQRRGALRTEVLDITRASLKSMIEKGRPIDWTPSVHNRNTRHILPLDESQIPSVKSDSLSWTVKQRKEIDEALEAVWRSAVDDAPTAPEGTKFAIHTGGLDKKAMEQYDEAGVHYLILSPAYLYLAHPYWPKDESEEVDERTEFYCEKDVEKHMILWQEAATQKRLTQIELPSDASIYLAKNRRFWENWL